MIMFSMSQRRLIADAGIASLILLQAVLPASLFAQAATGGRVANSPGAVRPAASGFLSSATGTVFVRRGKAAEEVAKVGDVFGSDTVFRTQGDSTAVLVFADGQSVTLGADSLLRIDDFRFDMRDIKSSKATLGLMSGLMRVVTGSIHTANPKGLTVAAGDAAIGILSKDVTAFVVEVNPKSLGIGSAAVIVGEISIQTPVGPPILLAADQFSRWVSNAPPTAGVPLNAAPAAFQAVVAASRVTVVPSSSPIDIQSASVQAALGELPATAAGSTEAATQTQTPEAAIALVAPAATSGGGRGCVGSPC